MSDQTNEDAELLEIYFEESRELLEGIEADLLSLEATPEHVDPDHINRVFRAIHSVKGGAGFFNLDQVKSLAHAMENVLGAIRAGDLAPTSAIVEPLLNGADALTQRFNQDPNEAGPDFSELVQAVEQGGADASPPPPDHTAQDDSEVTAPEPFEELTEVETSALESQIGGPYQLYVWTIDSSLAETKALNQLTDDAGQVAEIVRIQSISCAAPDLSTPSTWHGTNLRLLLASADSQAELAAALQCQERDLTAFGAPADPPEAAVEDEAPRPAQPPAAATPASATKPRATPKSSTSESSSIRVRLPLLDRLMTLAGELVLARNQLVQAVGSETDQAQEASQRIDHITTELQDAIMSTRMQSVGTVFHKFRRIVRDLSRQLGKDVELTIEGEDVELDRTVIESISDPLTHLVRNALDHGLESPQERAAAGKPTTGQLRLVATHKAGNVLIEISEDGRGINSDRIRQLAMERGLYSFEELATMTVQGLNRIVMQPGFSTASQVTDISGRGVGMDVVNSNIKQLGGSVDLHSVLGQGTTVRVKLPLTLAIIPALLVTEEGRRFAIPQANLIELHRIPAAKVSERILALGDAEVLTLRGTLLPIVRLRSVLNMPDRTFVNDQGLRQNDLRQTVGDYRRNSGETRFTQRRRSVASAVHVAVVGAGEFSYGLVLESWQETSEIVVKPLGRHLRQCSAYAGATILGDGDSALILDVTGIGARLAANSHAANQHAAGLRHAGSHGDENQTLPTLLLRGVSGQLFAVPLELVTRVERTTADRIQTVMGIPSLRYHGGSLPLLSADLENATKPIPAQPGYVAVFRHYGEEIGVFAADLLDITSTTRRIDTTTMRRPGCLGSFHLGDELVLLLDLAALASQHFAHVQGGAPPSVPPGARGRVLIVEPTDFFRGSLGRSLVDAGYEVVEASGENEAFACLDGASGTIDAVLIDMDSPDLLSPGKIVATAKAVAGPIVGTTASPPPSAAILERASEAGVYNVLGKMNPGMIVQALADSHPRVHQTPKVAS